MQTVQGRTPFRILGSHGVPKAQVALFEKRFGQVIPGDVLGPDDVLGWAFGMLSWERVARVLALWVLQAVTKARIQDDRRVQEVLRVLRNGVTLEEAGRAQEALEQLMVTFARVRGLDPTVDADALLGRDDLDDEFKAWVACYAAACAAVVAAGSPFEEGTGTSLAQGVIRWVIVQDIPEARPYTYDEVIKHVMGELADYVGSWAKAGQA